MCFSAEASFAGGVVIAAIGVATVTKVHKPSQLIFASIPLFLEYNSLLKEFCGSHCQTQTISVFKKLVPIYF
jgi:hypothetical protein